MGASGKGAVMTLRARPERESAACQKIRFGVVPFPRIAKMPGRTGAGAIRRREECFRSRGLR